MPKKQGEKKTGRVDFAASQRFLAYIDELIAMEGFGNSRGEVARRFVWKEINRLIEAGRLRPKSNEPAPD